VKPSILHPAVIAYERDLLTAERVVWGLLPRVKAEPRRSILAKKHDLICGILHNIALARGAAMARCIANLERTLPPHKLAKLAAKLQRDVVMPETPLRPAEQNAPQRRPHGPGDPHRSAPG